MFFPFFDRTKFKGFLIAGENYRRLKCNFPFKLTWWKYYPGVQKAQRRQTRWYKIQEAVEGVYNVNTEYSYIEVGVRNPEKQGIFLKMTHFDEKTDKYKETSVKIKEFPKLHFS